MTEKPIYRKGDRVKFREEFTKMVVFPYRMGTVAADNTHGGKSITIIWDGLKSKQNWDKLYLEKVKP